MQPSHGENCSGDSLEVEHLFVHCRAGSPTDSRSIVLLGQCHFPRILLFISGYLVE